MRRLVILSFGSLVLGAGTSFADPPGDRWHLEAGLVGGYENVQLTVEYDPFDSEAPGVPTTSDSGTVRGASGALEFAALWRATRAVHFGPFARAGVARSGSHFSLEPTRRALLFVGPAIGWILGPTHAVEMQLRGGFVVLDRRLGGGFAAGMSFALMSFETGELRLGFEGSALWARDGEDADFGRYTYREQLVGFHLALGVRL